MFALIYLLIAPVTIYIACKKPEWFWTAWVCGPLLLETIGLRESKAASFIFDTVQIGPITLRGSDQALIAMAIAISIYVWRHGFGTLVKKPGGLTLSILLLFIVLKVAYSVLIAGDLILANRVTSHMAGGLVAALGDGRDNLVAYFPPFYAYFIKKSRDLKALGLPIFVGVCLLLGNWLAGVLTFGHIWTGNINPQRRPINAGNAIDLTIFCLILFFVHVPRLPVWFTRSVATVGVVIAILANHRSQWMACAAGATVLLLVMLIGRPISRKPLFSHSAVAGLVTVMVSCVCLLNFFPNIIGRTSIIDDLSIRFYAFTQPSSDPDAQWRRDLWTDRIQQVGDNWPWGRAFGARPETLMKGEWMEVPDHSAYISAYEMGGATLCLLIILFFGQLTVLAVRQLIREKDPEQLWPPAVGLAIIAANLAFGGAYFFQQLGPALAVVLLFPASTPYFRTVRAGFPSLTPMKAPGALAYDLISTGGTPHAVRQETTS